MEVRNRWGTAVDPVPFLVVAATAFTVCYSFGPVYFLTLDVGLVRALGATTCAYLAVIAGAFYRLVWTFRPEYREEVPVGRRFRRLLLGAAVTLGALVLFALPLVAG